MAKKDIQTLLKIIIIVLIQTIGYLLVKYTPMSPHLIECSWDHMIPFIPQFIYFYISWYFMLLIIPYILYKQDEKSFNNYMKIYKITLIVSFLIYFIYPTTINRPLIISSGISDQLTNLLYRIDTPVLNCMPSMHCLICFIQMFYLIKCKRLTQKWKIILIVWELLIVLSTVLLKQHLIIDGITALIIAFTIYIIVEKEIKIQIKLDKKTNK